MKITAYPLYGHAAALEPSPDGRGWDFLCPCAFEALWHGGPGAGDVEIRGAEDAAGTVGFVRSVEGEGRLTFYPGYQCGTGAEHALWVRGPINAAKDGAVPLETVLDTSILPGTLTVQWRLTRPGQTVRFAAGEPFCTILPYPKAGLDEVTIEVVPFDSGLDDYQRALESLAESAALRDVFERLRQDDPGAKELIVLNDLNGAEEAREPAEAEPRPAVSCICLTYARPALLEEAIHSFLRQDYRGTKELIVVNDYTEQILELDHPEVQVVNLPKRLHTVGEKMNLAVALATHDVLFVWDDDDIYLPHRLGFSVEKLAARPGFFKPDKAWVWSHGRLEGPVRNIFHVGSCWTRQWFDEVSGYPAEGTGYDLVFERRLQERFKDAMTVYDIRPEEIYYLYRWGGTGSYHMSGFGGYRPGANAGHQQVEEHVRRRARQGEVARGRIRLVPRWRHDYSAAVAALLESCP